MSLPCDNYQRDVVEFPRARYQAPDDKLGGASERSQQDRGLRFVSMAADARHSAGADRHELQFSWRWPARRGRSLQQPLRSGQMTAEPDANLLEIDDLRVQFHTDQGLVRALDGVSLKVREGGTLGIVGESGCGKSLTALSILRLVPEPPGKIVSGEIIFEERDLLKLSEKEMRQVRGRQIAMIFQEPMTALNPRMKLHFPYLHGI